MLCVQNTSLAPCYCVTNPKIIFATKHVPASKNDVISSTERYMHSHHLNVAKYELIFNVQDM